ncbi:MAG: hypothetical protein WBA89_14440 [Microcoleus sp.]|uniref:hypothetical protein n=1 Tax=Microcoleus sp. TaxID=44472 RepID=UPI003C7742EC
MNIYRCDRLQALGRRLFGLMESARSTFDETVLFICAFLLAAHELLRSTVRASQFNGNRQGLKTE